MEKDYGEILCTAIDEIVSTRLQGLKYDITKQCTIKDDSRAHQGRYVVSDGGSRFEAFSQDTSFKNGNSVLVTIPNGDFTMQKTIVGRIASVDTTPFKYVSPLDSMIKIREGMLENIEINETGLLANRNQSGSMIECFTVPSEIATSSLFAGYTRLGISADFKSVFSGYEVVEGSYGVKILIYADVMTSPGEIDKEGVWELTFSSEEMVGNPYQFPTYFQQEKVFDISDIANIREIKVYFYQNGNFKDVHGDYLPDKFTTSLGTEYLLNNLFVHNFKFYFGYELERYSGETIELYPENSTMTYHHSRQNELKTIGLRWIHQDEDGTMGLLESEELFKPKEEFDGLPEFEIKWFKYNFGHPVIDTYAKVNWEHVTECIDYQPIGKDKTQDDFNNKGEAVWAYLNTIDNNYVDLEIWPDLPFEKDTQFFEKVIFNPITNFTFAPNINLQTEKIKAIGFIRKKNGIELNKTAIESDGGCYVCLTDIQDYWDMYFNYKERPTDKQPIAPNKRYIKNEDGTYTEDANGTYVKLTYEQIVGLQSKVTYIPHRADDNVITKLEKKTNAQYLEDLESFVKLFTYQSAYILDPYYSRELILTNEEKVIDQLTYDAATALRIVCEDGSEGNYLIYDQNGKLKNEGQGKGYERNFKLTYKGLDIDLAFEQLDDIDWVEWYIPNDVYDTKQTSTMLSIPNFREHTSRLELDGVDYLCFKYSKEYVPVTERYIDFTREIFENGKYYIQSTADTSQYLEIKEWNPDEYTYYEYRFARMMQPYSIKNDWVESASNNFVRVAMSINGNVFEAIEEMKFGKGGSNGTDTTFLLEFLENVNALEAVNNTQIKVKARLYEGHREVEIPTRELMQDVTWLKWKFNLLEEEDFIEIIPWKTDANNDPIYESGKPTLYIEKDGETRLAVNPVIIYNNEYIYQIYNENAKYYIKDSDGSPSIAKTFKNAEEFKSYIGYNPSIRYLKFTGTDANISRYFENNFHILQGTYKWNNIDLVTYLSVPLKFNSSNINISHIEGAKEVNYNHQGQPSYYANPYKVFKKATPYEEINEVIWEINNPEEIKDDKARAYIPSLKEKDGKYMFVPSIYYAEGAQNKICIYCKKETNYYWSQPILIYKHRYDFDILNSWNGGLQTDEANGTIMANMLGAGRKNEDNTFSGVMMGDMAKGTGNDSAYAETGIYGLYKGDVSFALKDNGTATFGIVGRGQIHIDGNDSTIKSSGYTNNMGGMLIDLDDGIIDIQEAEDKNAGLYLRSRDDTYLIKIDNQNQVLRSNQYSSNNGMEINLGQGYINIAGLDGQVKISETTPYFSIKGNASIGNKLYIKQDDKIIEKLFYNDFIPDSQYYIDEYCTLPISFTNEQEYKVYLQNLKPLIEIGAPKMTETASGFYLRSLDYNPADAKVENTSGNDVYESIDGTYHSLDSTTDTWYQNTNTNQGYVQTTNKSDIGIVSDEELEKAKKDWQKANVKDDGSLPPVTKDIEDELLKDLQNGKRAEFENKLSLLYSDFGTGLQLDLQNGKIEGYNLFLRAVQEGSKTNSLLINSSDSTYPFIIGGGFKVSWKGDLTCRSWHYGTIKSKYKNSVLCINSGFYVNANGKGYISDAGYASSAGYADNADNARYASSAGNAAKLGGLGSDSFAKKSDISNFVTKSGVEQILRDYRLI